MDVVAVHWPAAPAVPGLPDELQELVQECMVPVVAYNVNADIFWHAVNAPLPALPLYHTASVTALALDTTGQFLASGGNDFVVYIWHRRIARCALRAHWAWIIQIVFCPNTVYVVTVCNCCLVRVWDRDTGALLYVLNVSARHVAFNTFGTRMVVSGVDSEPVWFNTEAAPAHWVPVKLRTLGFVVTKACFSDADPDKYILYCPVQGYLQTMQGLSLLECYEAPMASQLVHWADHEVFFARDHGQFWTFGLFAAESKEFVGHSRLVKRMVIRGNFILTMAKDRTIILWHRASGVSKLSITI